MSAQADMLSCSVCFHNFDTQDHRPWDIGCGHSFCEACLRQHPGSFRKCPECRKRASNPHVNIAVMRMLDSGTRPAAAAAAGAATPAAAGAAGAAAPAGSAPAGGRGSRPAPPIAEILGTSGAIASGSGALSSTTRALISRAFRAATQQQQAVPSPGPNTAAAAAAAAGGQPAGTGSTLASLAQQPPHELLAHHQAKIAEWRTAMWLYLTPVLGFLYLLSPLDIIPDFLPLIGWMDDFLVLLYVAFSVYSMMRPAAARRNTMQL